MRAYLCGSIEYSPDHGKAWRAEITPFLRSLGHSVYDPARDEKKNLTDDEAAHFRSWKSSDLPRFQQTLRKIIAYDLDILERDTDYVVAYWDEYAGRGAGSQGELTFAHRRGIPIFLVSTLPASAVSGWILGCATHVFHDFEQLRAHLAGRFAAPALAPAEVSR